MRRTTRLGKDRQRKAMTMSEKYVCLEEVPIRRGSLGSKKTRSKRKPRHYTSSELRRSSPIVFLQLPYLSIARIFF
jgi:hypothetical protein